MSVRGIRGNCELQGLHGNLYVVAGDGPSLLGCEWLRDSQLDWKNLGIAHVAKTSPLEALLWKHKELFQDDLGTIRNFQAQLTVKPDARPQFFRPCPVPFALKEAVDQELDRLELGWWRKLPTVIGLL